MKNSNDTIWDRTATFRFVAQHLNHCATTVSLMQVIMLLSQVRVDKLEWSDTVRMSYGWITSGGGAELR